MIKFSLKCKNEHGFEAWFRNSEDYDLQIEKGFISCPICGEMEVDKAIMAPNIGIKSNQISDVKATIKQASSKNKTEGSKNLAPDEFSKKLQEYARSVNSYVKKNAKNVGDKFYDEARKMHYMEKDEKAIYGTVNNDQLKKLDEEGIKTLPLPSVPEDNN